MESQKGQKRSLDHSEASSSETGQGDRPAKYPRRDDSGAENNSHKTNNNEISPNSPYTLEYQTDDINGDTGGLTTKKGSHCSGGYENRDGNDSQVTVIVSDDEVMEVVEIDLIRAATMEHDVQQHNTDQPGHSSTSHVPCPTQLWKNTSLIEDANMISTIIPDADKAAVMNCLVKHRADPNRLNIVTATVLDSAGTAPTVEEPATRDGAIDNQGATVRHETNNHASNSHNHASKTVNNDCMSNTSDTNTKHADHGPDKLTTVPSSVEGHSRASNVTPSRTTDDGHANTESSLYNDVKKVFFKIKDINPQADINPTAVFLLLEQHQLQINRVDLVCDSLLNEYAASVQEKQVSSSDGDIFNQAMKLNSEFPHVNPSEIYELLEKVDGQENGLQSVREKLKMQSSITPVSSNSSVSTPAPKPSLCKEDSVSNDPLVRNDPVFKDMRVIAKMFPERDQNELYALVEAHYYKPNRVQVVIEELLQSERNSQDNSLSSSLTEPVLSAAQPTSTTPKPKLQTINSGTLLQMEVAHLRDVFPDCDPNYIFERLEASKDTPDRVRVIAAEMFERKNYPKLKEMHEKQTKAARKRHLHNLKFTVEEFLAKFPDPDTTFHGRDKEMKDSYKAHVTAQLKHDFADFKRSYVTAVTNKHGHHLLPIVREMETTRADILAYGGRSKKLRFEVKDEPLVYPEEPDEYFFYELWFTLNEQKVKAHFEQKTALQKEKVEEARARNELYECGCCFEDECLFEDMNVCADGHLFCRQCIARSAEAAFGEGKTTFPCLTGVCEHQIPLSVLKEVLPSTMFSKMLRKLQEEEVRQAGIADLVDCPFCSFATIMSDPDDRVFRCLNPECLRDSCRLCREPNHVPLKCEEVEKQNETDMRTFIEKRVTEAMLRKCHRCGKRFVKDVGCNKMTCICGASSCYVCREPDIDYEHFNGNRCNEGDMNKLHQQEMEKAAEDAKQEYLRDHPEAADINLKLDTLDHIKDDVQQHDRRKGRRRHRTRRRRR